MADAVLKLLVQVAGGCVEIVLGGHLVMFLLSLVLVGPLSIWWMRRIQAQREAGEVASGFAGATLLLVLAFILILVSIAWGMILPRMNFRDHTVAVFVFDD